MEHFRSKDICVYVNLNSNRHSNEWLGMCYYELMSIKVQILILCLFCCFICLCGQFASAT